MKNRQLPGSSLNDAPPDRTAHALMEIRAAVRLLARAEAPVEYRLGLLAALEDAIGALEEYPRRDSRHLDRALRDLAGRRRLYEMMAGAAPEKTALREMLNGWITAITGELEGAGGG